VEKSLIRKALKSTPHGPRSDIMDKLFARIAARPTLRLITWVAFAVVFFQSGLATTTWLLEPESFGGGWEWLWLIAFPPLLVVFFYVNRHLGCASGQCSVAQRHAQVRFPPGH
jgi:hypothetical protein